MGAIGHRHRDGSKNADGLKIEESRAIEDGCDVIAPLDGRCFDNYDVDVVDGSCVLSDLRKERYCQNIVSGCEQLEAWYKAFCDDEGRERCKRTHALSYRFRCGSSEDVVRRIEWLTANSCITSISKREKVNMLDELLKKTYSKAMDEHASAKDVGAYLDVLARHDMVNGGVAKPKLEIVFPQFDQIFGKNGFNTVEKKLGVSKE